MHCLLSHVSVSADAKAEKVSSAKAKKTEAKTAKEDTTAEASAKATKVMSVSVAKPANETCSKTEETSMNMNQVMQNNFASIGTNRPYALSCKSDYTSWDSLADQSYYSRHLPPKAIPNLPPVKEVVEKLFTRKDGIQTLCPRSSLLFPTFAQHAVDSFIITRMNAETGEFEWDRNDSTNEVGLSPLYGDSVAQTSQLREKSETPGRRGRLKTQIVQGEEWAPFLYDENGIKKEEFSLINDPDGLKHIIDMMYSSDPNTKMSIQLSIFAFGGRRANLTPNIVAWNTLLLREHNRLAGEIEKSEPEWDDERVFQTARNVLIVIYIKVCPFQK